MRNFWSLPIICSSNKPVGYVVSSLVGRKITTGFLEGDSNISARVSTEDADCHGYHQAVVASVQELYLLVAI